jgi:ABC-type transport system substrate-binding protein
MRRSALALLVPLAALGLACSSSKDDAGSGTTTTTAAASTTTTAGGGGGSTSTTKAGPTACAASSLSAELGQTNAGAGQVYQPLVLRNTGTAACELRGFPGVSVLDSAGTQIGQPATRDGAEGAAVTLQPGGAASATLHTANGPIGGPCEPASATMKVFPPGSTEALTFAASYTVCGGFSVTTLVAGADGTS